MTKEKLEQLSGIKKEIETLKDELHKAGSRVSNVADVVKGSNIQFPYQPVTYRIEGVDIQEYDRRTKRIYRQLNRKLEELMDAREEIEEFIEGVEDSEIRTILRLKYINGLTWRQVCESLGYAGDGSSQSKKIQRFLDKL